MPRATTVLLVFFVAFNAFAFLLMQSGVAAAIGINAQVGGTEQREDVEDNAEDVPTGGGALSTLVGMFNVVTGFVAELFGFLTPGVTMLENAGLPPKIGDFLISMFAVFFGIDIASFLAGRRL